ncbi:MlaE family ABC transporter permease [Desulfopila inferna]|uniref:MlaE family ABC transporter permease n=1 Tax=Desulfopila inferna TaxID=468528 RepID=UPI0019659755|nr:MlaE family lipid ABC transporter permease subunit [Desulfopila inferna]MBM9604257.1 ABC transporter permease [Desulfopila inferna]
MQNNPIRKLGNNGLYVLKDLGRMGLYLLMAVRGVFKPPFRFAECIKQIHFIGAGSLVVIFFTAISTGMVLGLQGYYSLSKFGAEGMLGSAVSLTLIMELGPVLTALMVAGRAGSAMCAELGIMRISEQIDALDCMAVDPFRYLISPKFIAALISVPLLTAVFDVVGIAGGYIAGVELMGVNPGSFMEGMKSSVTTHDIRLGFIKSVVFGMLVVWICTGRGFFVHLIRGAGFGAESVSKVTTQAVVLSSISVLIFDYLLTAVLL